MVLLVDEAQVKACFDPFGDSGNIEGRSVHSLRRTYHRLGNHFGRNRWNSWVMWVMANLVSIHLGTVLVLVQDRCTVCAKCTIGSGIILDEIDGTPR